MTESSKASNPISNNQEHAVRMFIRGNNIIYKCDHCNKEIEEKEATKISRGKNKDYVYCPECTKELYPKYKKISFYNPNPTMNNIMRDSLARKEYRR